MTPDVNVNVIDLPAGNELVTENEDGSYTVLINARLSYDEQVEAYNHAMGHILNEDFEKYDVQMIETEAHNKGRELK